MSNYWLDAHGITRKKAVETVNLVPLRLELGWHRMRAFKMIHQGKGVAVLHHRSFQHLARGDSSPYRGTE